MLMSSQYPFSVNTLLVLIAIAIASYVFNYKLLLSVTSTIVDTLQYIIWHQYTSQQLDAREVIN